VCGGVPAARHAFLAVPARPAVNRSSAVLPGGRNSGQKAQKGLQKKKSWPKEFVAKFWLTLPKSGRKGAAEKGPQKIFKRSSLFLAVITTYL
jgi:hypothetical protein